MLAEHAIARAAANSNSLDASEDLLAGKRRLDAGEDGGRRRPATSHPVLLVKLLASHRRRSGLSAVRQAATASMLLRNWVVGRPHTLEVFQERLGPRRGIVFLYPRQQRAMTLAALRKSHF